MRVSPISFKGLWKGPNEIFKGGKDPRCTKGDVYKLTYTYFPFKDEDDKDVLETAMKYNSTIFAYRDKRDDDLDYVGPEAYFMPLVSIGDKLNITSADYEQVKDLDSGIMETDNFFEYEPLKKEDALELLKIIELFDKKNKE